MRVLPVEAECGPAGDRETGRRPAGVSKASVNIFLMAGTSTGTMIRMRESLFLPLVLAEAKNYTGFFFAEKQEDREPQALL